MKTLNDLDIGKIKSTYKNNYNQIQGVFLNVQSSFLSGIYDRYWKDLDSANIVLFFAKNLHHEILRQKDLDLNHSVSFENFWKNHEMTKQNNCKIVDIANETGLPKETARRKILTLIKNKTLSKSNEGLAWSPSLDQKKTYNNIIADELGQISKLIQLLANTLELNISKDKIVNELKQNYSFYWFHYLKTQLKYLNFWQKKIKDLELLLIIIQCAIQASNENIRESLQDKKKVQSKKAGDISATSISEVTGIPRATCIRKLEKLLSLKLVKKNIDNKRYFYDNNLNNNSINFKEINNKTIDIFSEFYLIILKSLNSEKR